MAYSHKYINKNNFFFKEASPEAQPGLHSETPSQNKWEQRLLLDFGEEGYPPNTDRQLVGKEACGGDSGGWGWEESREGLE